MNCQSVRQYIIAYADGELNAREHPAVVEHIQGCDACGALVNGHRKLRSALSVQFAAIPVSADLQSRLRQALSAEPEAAPPPQVPLHVTRKRWARPGRILALAASLAIVATLAWQYAAPTQAETPELLITERHKGCCSHHAEHQHPDLPPQIEGLAASITRSQEAYSIQAIAPDLSDHGFEFESANFCGVQIPTCSRGGHIIYARNDGTDTVRLSVFSVPRWTKLDAWGGSGTNSQQIQPFVVAQPDDPDLCFACWHKGKTNYICCGAVAPNEMQQLAGDVQIALASPILETWFAVASLDSRP